MSTIVTGASRGIGRATVEQLLSRGKAVVAVDLDVSPLVEGTHRLTIIQGDAADANVVEAACLAAGSIQGVVTCAGISRVGASVDFPRAEWDKVLAINLTAVFELMRRASESAAENASFVAVSSVTAVQGFGGRAAYSSSKSAIDGLVRSMAVELAPKIRVNSVVPGFVMTDIARVNIAEGNIADQEIRARTPMGRWGEPEDIASSICFLLGRDSSWITGTSLVVDGGWLSLGL